MNQFECFGRPLGACALNTPSWHHLESWLALSYVCPLTWICETARLERSKTLPGSELCAQAVFVWDCGGHGAGGGGQTCSHARKRMLMRTDGSMILEETWDALNRHTI